MKKLFTLFALLAMFISASAKEFVDYEVDFTKKGKSTLGWKGEVVNYDLFTADDDGLHCVNPEKTENNWDFQFHLFNGVNLDVDQVYTIKIVAKASGDASVNYKLGDWSGGIEGVLQVGPEEKEYVIEGAAKFSSNFFMIQFGHFVGTVTFKSVTITHEGKEEKPINWKENILVNGDASADWENPTMAWNADEVNTICAWAKEKDLVSDETASSVPHPAYMEEVDGNRAFVMHTPYADTEGDPAAWDNQFWIEMPQEFPAGTQLRITFRVKAEKAATIHSQTHKLNPSNYNGEAFGDIDVTTEWQSIEKIVDATEGTWSYAFNLNGQNKEANTFYFDDLSIQLMDLKDGIFVSGQNQNTGIEYDFDSAVELVYSEEDECYVGQVGTVGNNKTWVNEVMISTVYGNDKAYKAATIKPSNPIKAAKAEDNWTAYSAASKAVIKLPAAGVWKVFVDTNTKEISFDQLEGDPIKEFVDIVPNPTIVTLEGAARISADWDNQLWIIANRPLNDGEETVIEFDYVGSLPEAKTGTQCQGVYGEGAFDYLHWNCIGEVVFTNELQHISKPYKVDAAAAVKEKTLEDGTVRTYTKHGIVFNMAIVEEACTYTIKNVVWKTADDSESLIDMTGGKNFWIKSAGGAPQPIETDGIEELVAKPATSKAVYNIAGQRVSNNYKGIVVKNGSKFIVK